MSALQDARAAVAATLTAAGVPVTLTPASIDPPCVLVDLPTVERVPQGGDCVTVTVEIPIRIIGPQQGSSEQLARMLDLVEAVMVAVPRTGDATPERFETSSADLPAYRLTAAVRNIQIPIP